MSARLYRLGNIYTRIEGLIRKKHINENNKPLWFDVYKQFPPKYNPCFKRLEPDRPIKEIFYEEDVLRARIHKEFRGRMHATDLSRKGKSFSQILLDTCQQYISEGMTENEAIQKLNSVGNIKVPLKTDDEAKPNARVDIVDKSA